MSSPTYEQMQTAIRVVASVIHELRQRFDKSTNQNDVPVQPVLKKKQKELLFFRECSKRLGKKILVRMQQRSAPQLLNGREKFSVKWCDRPSSQYGCQDTNSAPDFLTEKTKRETMEEPDDEEKLSEYCNEALIKSASTGNVNSLSTPVSVPTITRSASTGNLGSTGNFSSSTAQQQPMFSSSVMLEIPHSEVESVPSSILSSACLLSRLEARERMCKSCRRAGPQYDSFFGCRHTKSCPGLLEYPSEMMKFLVDCEDITGQRHPTFSTKRAMEIAEECDVEEQSSMNSVGDCNRPYCCCSLQLARHYDYLFPLDTPSRDAVTTDDRSAKTASNLRSFSPDDYFGQTSENFSLEPLLGSLEDINSTKTCLQATHQRNYFVDEEWGLDFVSVGSSCVSLNTMEELDPEKWQLLEYSVRPFASFDDFFAMSSASSGNVFSPSTPVSVPTITRSASTGDFEDMESVPSSIQSSVSFLFSPPEARETVSLQTTIQKESYFLDEDWGLDFVSVADVVGSWERVHTMHTMEELEFFTGSTCTDDMGTSTFEDNESIPSSIQSSASLLSPFEAREKVRKLALQANNVDDFFELIPDDLLDNFFSDYKMLVRHKMLEEQCDNIREELMKQPKKADN